MKRTSYIMAILFTIGLLSQVHQAYGNDNADNILSAIDVARLLKSGKNDTEIAKLLSEQASFRREDALHRGKKDEQIIKYLAANLGSTKIIDSKKSIEHRFNADKSFAEAQYEKAAREYSLAIQYSKDDFQLYKARAATYKQYLVTGLPPIKEAPGSPESVSLKKARTLLCYCLYSDYIKLRKIATDQEHQNIGDLNNLTQNMKTGQTDYGTDSNVLPYYIKSAQQTHNIRRLHRLYQSQRSTQQTRMEINDDIYAYKSLCMEEDAALHESLKTSRDGKREARWTKYSDVDNIVYFYDKGSIKQNNGFLTVLTRLEDWSNETAFDLVQIKLSCRDRKIGTIQSSSYDEDGSLTSDKIYQNIIMRNIVSSTVEDTLSGALCGGTLPVMDKGN